MKLDKLEVSIETPFFLASVTNKLAFVPKLNKQGEKEGMVPIRVRRIEVACKRSNEVFRFPLTKREGIASFGDSRESAMRIKSRSTKEMRVELVRMLDEESADRLLNAVLYS